MSLSVLACANCGAPLTRQSGAMWSCLHCGALSRVKADGGVEVETKVADDVLASIRQLVLSGKKDEATKLAAQHGLPPETVSDLTEKIASSTIFNRTLNWKGWLMMLVFAIVVAGGFAAVREGYWIAWIVVVFFGFNLLVFLRAMIRTFQLIGKPRATATIRRATLIGATGTLGGKKDVLIYAFDVDVEPLDRSMGFRASVVVPVRQKHESKAAPGTRVNVCFAPDRSWVHYLSIADAH